MKYRVFLLVTAILITSCTNTQPTPTVTFASTSTPFPSETPTATPTLFLSPTPVALPPGEAIVFADGFSGMTHGTGATAIVLANMIIGGHEQWNPFVAAVDKQKFTTVAFNYRNANAPDEDIRLILQKLKAEGFERIVCIGASMGTRVCSIIAREPGVVGLVLIAGAVHHASVAESTYPKLFISGALDRSAYDIETGYEKAAEPKTLVIYENNRAHGTDLFRSADGDAFLAALMDFVNGLVK